MQEKLRARWKLDDEWTQLLLDGWVQVSAGGEHTCGLLKNGVALCWGANNHGQSQIPNEMQGAKFRQISTGIDHTCAVAELPGEKGLAPI